MICVLKNLKAKIMVVECLLKDKEFTVSELIDRLETVREVLKERETAVTPELLNAVDIAITWIKNNPLIGKALSLDEAFDDLINAFFRNF